MLHLLALLAAEAPLDWAAAHIHLITWPILVGLAWKVSSAFTKLSTRATKTVNQIDQMATNHFPHMEASLANQDVLLQNIDKNIGRLADKV